MSSEFVCTSMILFVFVIILQSSGSHGHMVPAIFVLGDSFVDVGNNNYLPLTLARADFPHNGIDFPGRNATGRFSNGKNAVDWLAEKVGLPSPPPYLSIDSNSRTSYLCGVNFASGGASILNETTDPQNVRKTSSMIDLTIE
ncbi:hypothetical protein CRG98_002137 [Punica granatum]|uniref:GDSL esterase/lipase n=1 Tax=Punica granatum TaxID=22663 RepID=A0A2I0LA16_PUNGR|nr:hypothetical protein CRG98_002137 [Punica granatum]